MIEQLKQIEIDGPFWTAVVEPIQLADPRQNRAFRALFVSNTRRRALGEQKMLLPGTILVLCAARQVRLRLRRGAQFRLRWRKPGGESIPDRPTLAEIEAHLQTGRLSLLLIQADPKRWPSGADGDLPQLTCLAGEINLDRLRPNEGAGEGENDCQRLYRALNLTPPTPNPCDTTGATSWSLAVNGSGLSVYGRAALPWQDEPVAAPFLLSRIFPDPPLPPPDSRRPGFRLAIEDERLTAEDKVRLINAWRRFSRSLNPTNPLNGLPGPAITSTWVTLEIANPLSVPRFYWEIAPWQEDPGQLPLHFERGEIDLILSDQQLQDQENPPTSLARVALDRFIINPGPEQSLQVEIGAGAEPEAPTGQLIYRAGRPDSGGPFQEKMTLGGLSLAFDPLETPQFLRNAQDLPRPEWVPGEDAQPLDRPLLWGFMPLEDGWAQLPIPNLTEQIYLDARVARLDRPADESTTTLLHGATAYGNDNRTLLQTLKREQPWSMTLINAFYVSGRWDLAVRVPGGEPQINNITLEFFSPEVVIDGLFWLSSGKPSPEDALPDLENWVSGLQSIPLKTLKPDEVLFPSPVVTTIEEFVFSSAKSEAMTYASLGSWSFGYGEVAEVIAAFQAENVFPETLLDQETFPLVWRRHPTLPMIQTLPLTQSKSPPNHPSPSRQLAPFILVRGEAWLFGVSRENGAATWPRLLGQAGPAAVWQRAADLPIAALSIPGLILDPHTSSAETGLPPESATSLPLQYRFDLPYSDELNALAQLPKRPRDPNEVSPLPDSPPPQPAEALRRETLAGHWQTLAERAGLASADAVAAFVGQDGQLVIRSLVEPLAWPVEATLDLDTYPGSLTLKNAGEDAPLQSTLLEESALRGISGSFVEADDGSLKQIAPDSAGDTPFFQIVAGSMAAQISNGMARDQRGLLRAASNQPNNLLTTQVELLGPTPSGDEPKTFQLTSTLQPLDLALSDGDRWQIWFRDLPVLADSPFEFERSLVRSTKKEDVNDPEALSREFNYLSGYEWRLGDTTATDSTDMAPLSIFNLKFYPLTLERVTVDQNGVKGIEIAGRLQLPLAGGGELEALRNVVRLIFSAEPSLPALQLSEMKLESTAGEWPLTPDQGEQNNSPHLVWGNIRLDRPAKAIVVEALHLKFFFQGADWSVPIDPLSFQADQTQIEQEKDFPPSAEPIFPSRLKLSLQLGPASAEYQASLGLGVRLGSPERPAFAGQVIFPLLNHDQRAIELRSTKLFDKLTLLDPNFAVSGQALQFTWEAHAAGGAGAEDLYFLPGMLVGSTQSPGFAALTFEIVPGESSAASGETELPRLLLKSCFAETLVACHWGDFLQTQRPAKRLELAQVFGSSAGNLMIGYTIRWQPDEVTRSGRWEETCLLNGFLEIKNLISWPKAMSFDEEQTKLTLPPLRPDDPQPALDHIRHTLRVLFNQHRLPVELLFIDEEQPSLLFNLAENKTWQFLAVVEHQLLDVALGGELQSINGRRDLRWTALQEVRFVRPETFREFVETDGERVIDPISSTPVKHISPRRRLRGYFRGAIQDALTDADSPDSLTRLPADTLLVEASAPHWIQLNPLAEVGEAGPPLPATALQFLPNGSQFGVLSSLQDYAPPTSDNLGWLLLTTPFLGRLQNKAREGLAQGAENGLTSLEVDPILRLHYRRKVAAAPPLLALVLSSWGDRTEVEITVSALDWPVARTWSRLDPISLEENWFRLQNPLPEGNDDQLRSIIAALPDTPARLSRAVALRRAFDMFKPFYPPQLADDYELPPAIIEDAPVWRPERVMILQSVDRAAEGSERIYAWHVVGLQILGSPLFQPDHALGPLQQRHVAATILPTQTQVNGQDNPVPLSLAVSPYVGLEFRGIPAAEANLQTVLVSAELLSLSDSLGTLRPTASQLREVETAESLEPSLAWAKETHRRLSPDSPIAIVRFRKIRRNTDTATETEALLATSFSFVIVEETALARPLSKHIVRLRPAVAELRFREGQFGGGEMPEQVRPFELAPPQTIGVQPIYLDGPDRPSETWPWGVSTLRLSVQYTGDKQGVIGTGGAESTAMPENDPANPVTLWWQIPHHVVQYRSTLHTDRPAAGLPPHFRAEAIKSLLPVLPHPPLPPPDSPEMGDLFAANGSPWRPVLPGIVRYLLLGNRAGTMLAIRHQLTRQRVNGGAEGKSAVLVSGSVPVQHRMPRPVSLPPNAAEQRNQALQSWAGYFEPAQNLRVEATPSDEAFLAACGDQPARRLRMTLSLPFQGVLSPDWDGSLDFIIQSAREGAAGETREQWVYTLELVDGAEAIPYPDPDPTEPDEQGIVRFALPTEETAGAGALRDKFKTWLGNKRPGDTMVAQVRLKPAASTDGFTQTLSFPLRVANKSTLPLPLQPQFIHFEDPEYNRLLISQAAHAERTIKLKHTFTTTAETELVTRSIKLSADRREYNSDSRLALRYDWEADPEPNRSIDSNAALQVRLIDPGGTPTVLELDATGLTFDDGADRLESLNPARLYQFSLLDLRVDDEPAALNPGDVLEFTLILTEVSYTPAQTGETIALLETAGGQPIEEKIVLTVNIVAGPVIPVPEAAYALLRWQTLEADRQVECVRFAWSPAPGRIELICPEDLTAEVVRRRAVFQWLDTVRPEVSEGYALQKIAQTGSTHFPKPVG